jgi:hypothetical protein
VTIQQMNQMPLSFTKNMGQWDEKVSFRANGGGATMWFTKEGVTYQFARHIESPVEAALAAARDSGPNAATAGDHEGPPLRLDFRNRVDLERVASHLNLVSTFSMEATCIN